MKNQSINQENQVVIIQENAKIRYNIFSNIFCDICGCDNTENELLINDGSCYNCNTQLN